jgi:hypothetical protein
MVTKINWLAIIGSVLICILFLLIFYIHGAYQLGFILGKRTGWSDGHYFILHRVNSETAGKFCSWLEEKERRSKP